MFLCPKCGNPTNCVQAYEYYWMKDPNTGGYFIAKQPHGLYHDCRKCSWSDRYAEESNNTAYQIRSDWNEDEN